MTPDQARVVLLERELQGVRHDLDVLLGYVKLMERAVHDPVLTYEQTTMKVGKLIEEALEL